MSMNDTKESIARRPACSLLAAAALLLSLAAVAPADDFQALPKAGWTGGSLTIKGLEGDWTCAVGYPAASRRAVTVKSGAAYAPGLYRLRFTVRAGHTWDSLACQGGLRVTVRAGDSETTTDWKGTEFTRVHQPETKTLDFLLHREGPFSVTFVSYVAQDAFENAAISKKGKPDIGQIDSADLLGDNKASDKLMANLVVELDPKTCFYHTVEKVEVARISGSATVSGLDVDKVLYAPGETLKGQARLSGFGPEVSGKLCLFLEHGVDSRDLVKEIPVKFAGVSRTQDFEVTLPERRLGHALVAQFVSADGRDRHEKSEYFNIEDDFFRVCIYYGHPFNGLSFRAPEAMSSTVAELKRDYYNCREMFFWAPEDMVAMSPAQDAWFAGQTGYHLGKPGLQEYIRLSHQSGIKCITYAKFCLYGPLGWKYVYDAPFHNKGAYRYPVGHWASTQVAWLDELQYGELVGWKVPRVAQGDNAWAFVGEDYGIPRTGPDLSPYNVRFAAEEMCRSIAMFGWDALRWDGHPRFSEWDYDYEAQRKAAMLVRYFKDIVNAKLPAIRHGYNYLGAGQSYDWASENYELDELCRGGGLLMNEDMRGLFGTSYRDFTRIVQTQGDFTRERGGYWVGSLMEKLSPRDLLVQYILVMAGGGHPCYTSDPVVNRYATRFSQYTFDETMRRLEKPEELIKPVGATNLCWMPYVFETAAKDGQGELVVNLLNLPPDTKFLAIKTFADSKDADYSKRVLNPGTDPLDIDLALPPTHTLKSAHLIDPFTLAVEPLVCKGNRISLPPVRLWRVLVAQMAVAPDAGAYALAAKWGPPKTVGAPHKDLKAERKAVERLDISRPVEDVCKEWEARYPDEGGKWWEEPAAYAAMGWDERNTAVLASRAESAVPVRKAPPAFGDLTPIRNGVTDIFYARGMIDYNLGLYRAFARLDKVNVQEATLSGNRMSYRLSNHPGAAAMPGKDLFVYADIPYTVIGEEQSAALADYIKAGGAALFTGGEYSFGKGLYRDTVLEQELLPVLSITPPKQGNFDNRYARDPLFIEPGPDLPELGVKPDFAARPAFWCWNEVAVRPDKGVKVFLKSGNRPVLVGWQVGKGRVACLPVMHKGTSVAGATVFFDWQEWPGVAEALLRWLAPEAGQVQPPKAPEIDQQELARLRHDLEAQSIENALDIGGGNKGLSLDATDGPGDLAPAAGKAEKANPEALKKRIAVLRRLMAAEDAASIPLVAQQLAEQRSLPDDVRFEIVRFLQQHPPANLKEVARQCLASPEAHVRGCGFQLMALAGDSGFPAVLQAAPTGFETQPFLRNRTLALAIALYGKVDLVESGRKRIADWNAEEQRVAAEYTDGKGFSPAAPALPCLGSEAVLARVGWLAYMSRFEPEHYAAQFAKEWCMIEQYQRFCDWTVKTKSSKDRPASQGTLDEMSSLQAFFGQMGNLTAGRAAEMCQSHPALMAQGLGSTHYRTEAVRAMNLLGSIPAERIATQLKEIAKGSQPLLAGFAEMRGLGAKSPTDKRPSEDPPATGSGAASGSGPSMALRADRRGKPRRSGKRQAGFRTGYATSPDSES